MRIVVFTSVDKSFSNRIGKGLRKWIEKEIKNSITDDRKIVEKNDEPRIEDKE